jgi:hypothetical protein
MERLCAQTAFDVDPSCNYCLEGELFHPTAAYLMRIGALKSEADRIRRRRAFSSRLFQFHANTFNCMVITAKSDKAPEAMFWLENGTYGQFFLGIPEL